MTRPFLRIRQIKFPAAHVREALSEGQIGFAATSPLVGLMLFGDVGRDHHARGVAGKSERTGVQRDENCRTVFAQMAPAAAETGAVGLKEQTLKFLEVVNRPDFA